MPPPIMPAARKKLLRWASASTQVDLSLHNLSPFLKAVPNVLEVSIGHALIADALEFGLAKTVQKYLQAIYNT
jgi:pyridoxine 5-phosphate synthase